jgi:hypothetical protein
MPTVVIVQKGQVVGVYSDQLESIIVIDRDVEDVDSPGVTLEPALWPNELDSEDKRMLKEMRYANIRDR